MFATITATLTFSTDWAGDMIGGIYCDYFGVTTEDLSQFHMVILTKCGTIAIGVILCCLLVPSNQDVEDLRRQLKISDENEEESDNLSG